jgi:hypothetical protein
VCVCGVGRSRHHTCKLLLHSMEASSTTIYCSTTLDITRSRFEGGEGRRSLGSHARLGVGAGEGGEERRKRDDARDKCTHGDGRSHDWTHERKSYLIKVLSLLPKKETSLHPRVSVYTYKPRHAHFLTIGRRASRNVCLVLSSN